MEPMWQKFLLSTHTYFVMGCITVQLTPYFTGLNSTKQVNLL